MLFAAAAAKYLQSCPTLCDPINGSPPGSAVPGILQARTLEWVAISFSNGYALYGEVKISSVAQSCPTLCDLKDCSTPGFPVYHQLWEFAQTHVHRVHDAIHHLILCCPLLLLPSVPPRIRVFSNESVLHNSQLFPQLFVRTPDNHFTVLHFLFWG